MLVSDVSGHGASSAMITGMVKQAFHAALQEDFAPTAVLERIAAASRLFPDGKYVTATAVRFRPGVNGARIRQRRASARDSSWVATGRLYRSKPSAPMIHPALPEWHCEQRVVRMERGDQLLLYTDGLTEAQNGDGDDFGFERLVALAPSLARPTASLEAGGRIC